MPKVKRKLQKDDFYKFVKSKEFSDLYKEVKRVISGGVEVKLKFGPAYIKFNYIRESEYYEEIICLIQEINFDKEFYSKLNILKDYVSGRMCQDSNFESFEIDELALKLQDISSYRGKDKELLKAKEAYDNFNEEFLNACKKIDFIQNKYKIDHRIIFSSIVESANINEAIGKLVLS